MTSNRVTILLLVSAVFVLRVETTNITPLKDITNVQQQLLDPVVNVANKYFPPGKPVTVLPRIQEDERKYDDCRNLLDLRETLIQRLHQSGNHALWHYDVPIKSQGDIPYKDVTSGSAIILLNEILLDDPNYNWMENVVLPLLWNSWDPKGKVIIVILYQLKDSNFKFASDLLTGFWLADILNTLVLIPSQTNDAVDISISNYSVAVDLYGWLPDEQDNLCQKIVTAPKLFDIWLPTELGFKYSADLFPKKDVADMKGCVVQAYIAPLGSMCFIQNGLVFSGYAVEALEIVSHKCNFRIDAIHMMEFSTNTPGFDPSTHIRVLTAVYSSTVIMQQMYDHTVPIAEITYTWIVPVGAPLPRWLGLVKIFSMKLWILLLATCFFTIFSLWLNDRLNSPKTPVDHNSKLSIFEVAVLILQIHLGHSVPKEPENKTGKYIFVLCLFYALQMYTAYQSCLIGFLANPGRYPPIKNRAELQAFGIELSSFLRNLDGTGVSKIVDPYKSVGLGKPDLYHLRRLLCDGDLAVAATVDVLELYLIFREEFPCVPKYSVLDDYFFKSLYAYGLTRGNIMFDRFNKLLLRMQSSGIILLLHDFWTRGSIFKVFGNSEGGPFVMTLSHFQGVFYLLFLGLSFSVFTFALEIVYFKCSSK